MTDFIEDLKDVVDDVLQVRDDIGAIKDSVYIVTRAWDGDEIGDGNAVESKTIVYPSPWIVDYSHSLRITEGGNIKQGDILLKQISQDRYPNEIDVDCKTSSKLIEKFYEIGGILYNVISVRKRYATWDVQVRRLKDQTRY